MSTYDTASHFPTSGKRVLVAGGAISALEIASELAQLGATRRGDPATPALCPAEVRRGRAVRLPHLHAVRDAGERDPLPGRGRSAAEGDRRRGGWQPGAVRCACTRPVAVRRRRHPRPAVPAAGGGGPNHGAAVADIGRRHDGDLRRRIRPTSSTGSCSAPASNSTCRSSVTRSGRSSTSTRPSRRRPLHLPPGSTRPGVRGHVGPVGRTLRAGGTSGPMDRLHLGRRGRRSRASPNYGRRSRPTAHGAGCRRRPE